jgi:hypothetical protein
MAFSSNMVGFQNDRKGDRFVVGLREKHWRKPAGILFLSLSVCHFMMVVDNWISKYNSGGASMFSGRFPIDNP